MSAASRANVKARNRASRKPLSLAHRVPTVAPSAPSVNPAMRPATIVTGTGALVSRNRRAGSDKGQNDWRTTSQNYRTRVTHDPRWSRTVSD